MDNSIYNLTKIYNRIILVEMWGTKIVEYALNMGMGPYKIQMILETIEISFGCFFICLHM
jgi:hypothetical protein